MGNLETNGKLGNGEEQLEQYLCYDCKKVQATKPNSLCEDCEKKRNRDLDLTGAKIDPREERLEQGYCYTCGKNPVFGAEFRCKPCNKLLSEGRRQLESERRQKGLCPECGDLAMKNYVLCHYHQLKKILTPEDRLRIYGTKDDPIYPPDMVDLYSLDDRLRWNPNKED